MKTAIYALAMIVLLGFFFIGSSYPSYSGYSYSGYSYYPRYSAVNAGWSYSNAGYGYYPAHSSYYYPSYYSPSYYRPYSTYGGYGGAFLRFG